MGALNHQRIEKVLLIMLEALAYFSFLMPFIFLNKSIFPFIVGKILYFQALVQIMLVLYLLLLAINFQRFKPMATVLLYWFYFYAVTLVLSAIFGVDFNRAFWSNFERMTGVFVVLHFIAYSIIISIVFDSWPKIKRAIQVLLAASLLQVAVVAAQYAKTGVYLYPNKGGRIWGTLGNSIYIGSYFLFHIFFAAFLAIKEKKVLPQILYLCIAFLETYIIVHSKSSRGADLALLFGVVFIVSAYAFLSKNKKIKIVIFVLYILGIMSLAGLFMFRDNPAVKKIPLVGGLAEISFQKETGRTRAIAWEIGIKAIKERPIFGWGLENFYYAFNKYYNPESLRHSYYETWFDRSHSIVFDTLATGGAVGFISYFGLFASGLCALFLKWKKGLADKHILVFLTAIFSTYLIQILFVFDHPGSYLLIFFSFGLLLSLVAGEKKSEEAKYSFTPSSFYSLMGVLILGFLLLFFSTTVKTYKAATGIIAAERIFVNNYKSGLEEYKEILSMKTPFIDDMRASMAKRVAQVNPAVLVQTPDYKDALLFVREEMLKQIKEKDIDVYDYIILGQLDTLLASAEKKYILSANSFFSKAAELSPKRQQIYYTWAKTKLMMNDTSGAEKLLLDTMTFEPAVPDSYWYLGFIYNNKGDEESAWKYFKKALKRKYIWKSPLEINFVLDLGAKLKKYDDMAKFYVLAITSGYGSPELKSRLQGDYNKFSPKIKQMVDDYFLNIRENDEPRYLSTVYADLE